MPRVKFEYIVSFSSEDPDNPASNLLSWEVNKKKWLCRAGETSGSVVVQFDKSVKIGTVQLGAHHAALVELLVGRSETPDQPYQVLVSSSVFQSPAESRRASGVGADRVRSFTAAAGDAAVWAQRWDRLRVVCSQPYNKHCKFGISFVHVFTPECPPQSQPPVAARLLQSVSDNMSSEDEEFRPGELFAQHKASNVSNNDTGAQIRRATSEAIKNPSVTSSKLVKTPLGKGDAAQKRRDDTSDKHRKQVSDSCRNKDDYVRSRNERCIDRQTTGTSHHKRGGRTEEGHSLGGEDETTKDAGSTGVGGVGGAGGVLSGVVCVLSGYVHPARDRIRRAALAQGAAVRPHWGPDCTHLICAFPNTPKLRSLRREHGADVPAVLAEWVLECERAARRLPHQWFATEPQRRAARPAGGAAADADDGGDTEPESEGEREAVRGAASLAPLLRGARLVREGADAALIRYVRAYGGTLTTTAEMMEAEAAGEDAVFVVCEGEAGRGGGARVRPRWVWDCHRTQRRVDTTPYLVHRKSQ